MRIRPNTLRAARTLCWVLLVALPWSNVHAQRRGGGGRGGNGGFYGRGGSFGGSMDDYPVWKIPPQFKYDVFTFGRLMYNSGGGRRGGGGGFLDFGAGQGGGRRGGGGGGGGGWRTDTPDADLYLALRLHQMTSLQVNPPPLPDYAYHGVAITPEDLAKYPFIYIVEPGHGMYFNDAEAIALRNYLHNGGFLMVDDFWGDSEWINLYRQLKRVFPNREPVELDMTHPIFHMVFDMKIRPQIPGIGWGQRGYTYEDNKFYSEDHEAHYYGIFDDKNRMMVFICRNTDYGDGWEREGVDKTYFEKFSEPQAYPMMINIIFYAMTH